MLLVTGLRNLNPGILLSLQTTPTSSECLQSDTPMPLDSHCARVLSFPVQWTLSNQMRPEEPGEISQNSVPCMECLHFIT